MMDRAMAHIAQGEADDAIDPDALLASLETASPSAR
jgi:hypothetical protein